MKMKITQKSRAQRKQLVKILGQIKRVNFFINNNNNIVYPAMMGPLTKQFCEIHGIGYTRLKKAIKNNKPLGKHRDWSLTRQYLHTPQYLNNLENYINNIEENFSETLLIQETQKWVNLNKKVLSDKKNEYIEAQVALSKISSIYVNPTLAEQDFVINGITKIKYNQIIYVPQITNNHDIDKYHLLKTAQEVYINKKSKTYGGILIDVESN